MVKDKIIKGEIKEAIKKYKEDSNLKNVLNAIRETFVNHCNYKELYSLNQFIKIQRDLSAVFFFYNGTVYYDYTTVNMEFNKNFKSRFFDARNKKNIIQEILNKLNEHKLIHPDFWTIIKFKDKCIVLRTEDSNEMKRMTGVENDSDACLSMTQLSDNLWDYSK
jgi:site-specific DNA-adenine methylase